MESKALCTDGVCVIGDCRDVITLCPCTSPSCIEEKGTIKLRDSYFGYNGAGFKGGALYLKSVKAEITDSVFEQNYLMNTSQTTSTVLSGLRQGLHMLVQGLIIFRTEILSTYRKSRDLKSVLNQRDTSCLFKVSP